MEDQIQHHDAPGHHARARRPYLGTRRGLSRVAVAVFALVVVAVGARLLIGTHAASSLISDNSKTACIYVGGADSSANASALAMAERATGMTFNCQEVTGSDAPSWATWDSPWYVQAQTGLASWVSASPSTRQLVVAQDLIPAPVHPALTSPDSWEQACDSGAYNEYAETFAQNLVAAGLGNSVIRLGPEMNATWAPDSMGTTAAEMADWAKCYNAEVTAMRAVKGATFQFVWNPNSCYTNEPFADYYPGDSTVDIIGLDQYDAFCTHNPPTTASDSAFGGLEAEPGGLNGIQAFASSHHKPMSLPQWGAMTLSAGGFGDDPYYIAGIGRYVEQHDVAFQAYFDEGDNGVLPLSQSAAMTLAAYKSAFGSSTLPYATNETPTATPAQGNPYSEH